MSGLGTSNHFRYNVRVNPGSARAKRSICRRTIPSVRHTEIAGSGSGFYAGDLSPWDTRVIRARRTDTSLCRRTGAVEVVWGCLSGISRHKDVQIEGKYGHRFLSGNDREQNDDKRNDSFTDKSESTVGESIDLPSLHHVIWRLFLARSCIGSRRNDDLLFHIRDVHSWSFYAGKAFEGEQMGQ